ncbi:polysaccharide deacetylase family protein [bacterium]|nr:polysaccharide deacetylase family protein [candidate division CSSED10-310 bacterium]
MSSVYLTFDDGPDSVHTPQILDILSKQSVCATFFLLGYKAEKLPAIVARIAEEGHTIGAHGYEHVSHIFKSSHYLSCSITRTQKIIKNITFKASTLFRPPYGHFSPLLINMCSRLSTKLVLWSIMSNDFNSRIPDEAIYAKIHRHLKSGSIIVFHDGHRNSSRTLRILPNVITNIRNAGYRFAAL